MGKTNKKSIRTKIPSTLGYLNGCSGCSHTCKYNAPIADISTASNYDKEFYSCNSRLIGLDRDSVERV